ncbi:hypothetical protein D2923_08670, partial [Vibrio cholerae]|uniref:hypothetical protein n=1 Tax=Vibrio cholerae TaxID=666 RepID=UPI0012856646
QAVRGSNPLERAILEALHHNAGLFTFRKHLIYPCATTYCFVKDIPRYINFIAVFAPLSR